VSKKNIAYSTNTMSDFYASNRRSWPELYPSERHIFEAIAARGTDFSSVLDVGCAAGGLGEALMERFGTLASYTGVDVHREAIASAETLSSRIRGKREFIAADICHCPQLAGRTFDIVTALGVADFNVDSDGILAKCWEHVRPGGRLVISLRLTPGEGISDVEQSYQYIWFDRELPPPPDAERAPYTVFNIDRAIGWLSRQVPTPDLIQLYGYWGKPSPTAHTRYDRLVFSVIAMRKPAHDHVVNEPLIEAELPPGIFMSSPASRRSS
jgi:SAM-dependent methyltransferase